MGDRCFVSCVHKPIPMKRYLLLLLLFLANSAHASSIWYYPFSKMLIDCKAYHICRYLRIEGDSLVVADRHSGKEFVVRRVERDNTGGDSYLVVENEENTYVARQYPYSEKNDQIIAQLSSRIRDINKMPDSEEKFRTCKKWIFSMMDVPFLRWYGFYEWRNNQIIRDYKIAKDALAEAGKSSPFKMMTPKENKALYKAFLTYNWPDFYTWNVVSLLDDRYNDGLVKYVCQFLEWTLTEDSEHRANDGSSHSACDFCGVHVLSAARLGGEEFLAIEKEYSLDEKRYTNDGSKVYIRRMVEALKKQFSR